MTPEQLKASILQYAVQGKLVEQRLEEGTAEDLIEKVKTIKADLVKNKAIKKEKPIVEITEDETPYDIPDTWKWCRCQEIFFAHSAMRIHQSDWKTEGIPFFRGRELVRLAKTGDPNAEIFISEEFYNELKNKGGVPKKDDILISAVGTLGKVYVVKGTKPFYYKDAYILCLDNYGVNPHYIKYLVEAPICQNYIYGDDAYGTTVAQLTLEKLKNMLIPLPPLEEQNRIVAKIEEMLPLVERYAITYEKLEQFNAKFPEDMKKSILQYAIQGKLVEQRAEEGTAEELYQQIQEEKQKLIKEGKIKKEKPLAEITEDEVPFDIPESWSWMRLGSCTGYAQTKEKISPKDITGDMWSLDLEDIQKETGMILVKTKASERKITGDKVIFHKGQVLYSKLRPYLKKILVAPDDGICTPELVPFNTYGIDEKYMVYVLKSPHVDNLINAVTYGVKMPRVGTETMTNLLIPVPPLEEQKRIVTKIEQLLPYCDMLQEK